MSELVGKRIDVLCFGGEDWWYHNRAHVDMQLMRRFARAGRVLYVNSIIMRKLNITEGAMFFTRLKRKLKSVCRGLVEAEPNFFVASPLTFPVHHIPGADRLNQRGLEFQIACRKRRVGLRKPIVWVACPAACETAFRLDRRALVYQRTDRYEEYPGVDAASVTEMDRALKRAAELTVFANRALYDEESAQCRRALYLDHGVDYKRFASAESDKRVPPGMDRIKRPIVGFFGGIDDHTSDVALSVRVARLCPDMSFVFVGAASSDLAELKALPNVFYFGKRPYEEIPHFGKCFDVAIMPWRRNRWIEACNPIKLKEYLALGKPIVSTPFRELAFYEGLVYVAEGAEEFAACIRRALREDSDARRAARRRRVENETWEAKAAQALAAVLEEQNRRDGK